MKYRVLISCRQLQESIDLYRDIFRDRGIEIDLPEIEQQLSRDQLLEIIHHYDGMIAGDDEITREVLEKGQSHRLKVVAKWGIGVDGIDLLAASELGIEVTNTPDMFADEVADVAMGYVVLLARRLHTIDARVRAGDWHKFRGMTLRDKVAGIIGVGSIGRAVGERARAFGMSLMGHDIAPVDSNYLATTGMVECGLEELLAESDFVILCCNLTAQNRHLINEQTLGLLQKTAYLVNVARGPLVDESALVAALRANLFAGAALDVFEREPLDKNHPLREFSQCVFGSHNSSNTTEGVLRVNDKAIENLLKGLGLSS